MEESSKSIDERIIKTKKRVQNHGEVFTPKRIVKKMLDFPSIRDACQIITKTFLEPASGEGIFLVEVLKRKLTTVTKKHGESLIEYENYSLLALSTVYGIELLEDNAQKCVMNMYEVYYEAYQKLARKYGKKAKTKVLNSAKLIISKNIVQGDFLTKLSVNGEPLVFCEWKVINLDKKPKTLVVHRTEYTLFDIIGAVEKQNGETSIYSEKIEQLDFFSLFDEGQAQETEEKRMKYIPVKITEVYKEEMEETDG